jgi:hypothetical protein
MVTEERQANILQGLQNLLEKQIELTRRGGSDSARFEHLNKQADVLVKWIAQSKILRQDRFGGNKEKLARTYDELCLAIKAEQREIAESLGKVRKGRKTISAYKQNL